jgi:hypothetical protein
MKLPITLALLFCAVLVWGQSAGEMERLLNTSEISCADAAYFVLQSRLENPPQNSQAAFSLALEKGWLSKKSGPDKPDSLVTMADISFLIMRAFKLEGGLMYRLFPGGRYAYREMISMGFIEGRLYSGSKVSGGQFLQILGNVLSTQENENE